MGQVHFRGQTGNLPEKVAVIKVLHEKFQAFARNPDPLPRTRMLTNEFKSNTHLISVIFIYFGFTKFTCTHFIRFLLQNYQPKSRTEAYRPYIQ